MMLLELIWLYNTWWVFPSNKLLNGKPNALTQWPLGKILVTIKCLANAIGLSLTVYTTCVWGKVAPVVELQV